MVYALGVVVGGLFGTKVDSSPPRVGRGAAPPPPAPLGRMGLSRAHICTRTERTEPEDGEAVVELARGGQRCRMRSSRSIRGAGGRRSGGGKRGKVGKLTEGSRRRLKDVFAEIDQASVVNRFFVHLTCRPVSPEVFKRMVRAYFARLERSLPGRWCVVWRVELHKSGAPHLHFMMYWRERSPDVWAMRRVSDLAWSGICGKVVGPGNSGSVRLEYVNQDGAARGYCCKAADYVCKRADAEVGDVEGVGRWWGIVRREHLPVSIVSVRVTESQRVQVSRLLRKFCAKRCKVGAVFNQVNGASVQVGRGGRGTPLADFNVRKRFRSQGLRTACYGRRFAFTETIDAWAREDGTGRMVLLGPEVITQASSSFPVSERTSRAALVWALGVDLVGPLLAEGG